MPTRVYSTALADHQVRELRARDRAAFGRFAEELSHRGCAALSYRLTGPRPLSEICVKHLSGPMRAVVAFRTSREAWILMVGPHLREDPALDIYTLLYALAGIEPPENQRRSKPPCCDGDSGLPAELADAVEELVARARMLGGKR